MRLNAGMATRQRDIRTLAWLSLSWMYKAKVAVCSDIRTKNSTQSERHVEFLDVKHCGT